MHLCGLGLDRDVVWMGGSGQPKRLTSHAWYHSLLKAVYF